MAEPLIDQTLNPIFSPSEIEKMERIIRENKDEATDGFLYKKLAEEFNVALGRTESEAIKVEQVQEWCESIGASSPVVSKKLVLADTILSNDEADSLHLPKEMDRASTKFAFEAKSSRDEAWYDVGNFISHRYLYSGEIEARIRFKDFGPEDDEWVNVDRAVRERSIPFDSSDCEIVKVGDLVLCFRESSEHAMYFDAHITEIARKQHDNRVCDCIFSVRYYHDQVEETVTAKQLCRRPG